MRYPSEEAALGAVAASFALGEAPPGSKVTVNGRAALVAPDGGWIAYVPFAPGRFTLHVRARSGSSVWEVDRTISVADASEPAYPAVATVVQPGDALDLAVTAPRGSTVTADGPGFTNVALVLDPRSALGTYRARVVAEHRGAGPAPVVYRIASPNGMVSDVASNGTLAVAAHAVLFVGTVIAYEPDAESGSRPYGMIADASANTDFTVPLGTRLGVIGRVGNLDRVGLPGAPAEWIDRRELAADPADRTMPEATVRATRRTDGPRQTEVVISLAGARVPFRVIEAANAMGADATGTIRLYGAAPGSSGAVDLPFSLHQHAFWGYRSRWSGEDLVLEFRKPPVFSAPSQAALRGLKVVVDPGHSPDSGAIGPIGTEERDVNLDIATRLAAKLRASGASVFMTRTSNEGVRLYDRPALAEDLHADVLISVHNNAPPDGVDPSSYRGYTVYYFQPHSKALAQAIHDRYASGFDLHDGGVHVGDYALVRTSQLPAVLTESAFITWPWEEMQLRDPAFRDRLAAAMAGGMERWAEKMRALESAR